MKIKFKGNMYDVISRVKDNENIYFVMDRFGKLFFFNSEEVEIFGEPIVKELPGNAFFEMDYLDEKAVYKIWGKDFANEEEKIKYLKLEEKLYKDYSKYLRKDIKKDYYKERIEKGKLDIWENNFEDKVYKVEDNKYYIDDDEYDIFYEIINKGKYKFEFIEK